MSATAHVFVFNVQPTAGSPHMGKVGKAMADVWVVGFPIEESEARARECVLEQSWVIISLDQTLQVEESEILRYREDAQASFRQAKERGISASFAWSPPQDREDNIVEIFHMSSSLHQSGSKH